MPLGKDKGELAEWVRSVATYNDLERYVYLLFEIRQLLDLPFPAVMRDKNWLPRLQQRAAEASEPAIDLAIRPAASSAP